jgi:CRISPR-associated protein Csm3
MVYRVMDTGDGGQTDLENFKHVEKALELLQLDGLGGYISRGYGQVELDYRVEDK